MKQVVVASSNVEPSVVKMKPKIRIEDLKKKI
jgi:hypothetical protein